MKRFQCRRWCRSPGRAIHGAPWPLLLINVIDCESQFEPRPVALGEDAQPLLIEMKENLEALTIDRVEEAFHDAVFAKERAQEYFAAAASTHLPCR